MAKQKDTIQLKDCTKCVNSFWYEGMLVCSMRIKDIPRESSIVSFHDCSWFKEIKENTKI